PVHDPTPTQEKVNELAEVLDGAVARLPRKYREAVVLRFYEGREFAELAEGLSITEAAARKGVERGIGVLRGGLGVEVGASLMAAAALVGAEVMGNGQGLVQTTIQTALAAKASGAAPAGMAATVKGVSAIMAMSKVQAAAIAAAVVV